jgi:LuxR family transcriptional regulator, maltose regulon positive regulatory protein
VASALVRRDDLFGRFPAADVGGVMLVCAPAGSGKSMLARSWVETAGLRDRTAWVPVERGERDAQRFWLSVIDSLAAVLDAVRRVDPAPAFQGDAVVDQLLCDLGALDEPAVLVIDDLHELTSADALAWLERLLGRLPRHLRVVLATREEPQLALHRLRLTGRLTELRAADLRFSRSEAAELLRAAGIRLSDAGLALLYARTEGWAAGLRLAAISLVRHPDPERFVAEFSGSERTVAGYLLEEVLERQPPPVRELLLRTAVLDRVSGPLADHLTGGSGSERVLQELEDANAFVTSEDASRSWFRYHHLFADLLRLELRRIEPDMTGALHRAAAEWFEEHGDTVEAIRHAQAAHEWARAARLLFEGRVGLILDGRLATVRALLDAFPERVAADDPELAIVLAGVRLRDGLPDDAAVCLAIAEREAGSVAVERKQLYDLQLAGVRLELARLRGDLAQALGAMGALEAALAPRSIGDVDRMHDIRALALMTLGVTELWALRLDDARRRLAEGLALARHIDRPYLEIGCLAHLAIVAPLSGRSPSAALEFAQQAVALAEEHGLGTDPIVALAFAIGGGSLAILGRLAEAEQWLQQAESALRRDGDPGTELALHHARGLLHSAQGRLQDAVASFRRAEEVQSTLAGPHALTVDVRRERLLAMVRAGELADVAAELAGIPADERERAEVRIPAGALALAEGRPDEATERLAPVIERSVNALLPTWYAVYASLFDAAAREQLGDARGVEDSIERALELAEPEGLMLPFMTAPVKELLESHPRHRSAHGALLSTIADVFAGTAPQRGADAAPLLDELSEAELRVMRYLPSNLRAREIAAELLVSTNTVRTHLRHIYAKLDAHDRAEAVKRARELGLLAPSLPRR